MKAFALAALVLGLFSIVSSTTANKDFSTLQLSQAYKIWLQENYPVGNQALNTGASEQQLSQLETQLSNKLPATYREWLSLHNGQDHSVAGLLVSSEFFSTKQVIAEWHIMKSLLDDGKFKHTSESDPAGAIKNNWWNIHWIPIGGDGSGNLICLDMSPDKKGQVGQVIDFDHETVHRTVLADSFSEYITDYLNDLKSGQYKYSEDYGQILPLTDL